MCIPVTPASDGMVSSAACSALQCIVNRGPAYSLCLVKHLWSSYDSIKTFEIVTGLPLNRYSKQCPFTKESASAWGPWGKGRLTSELRGLNYAHKLFDNIADEAYSI